MRRPDPATAACDAARHRTVHAPIRFPAKSRHVEQRIAGGCFTRHRHAEGYAAILLEGGYLEAGDAGCWQVSSGDIVAHEAFSAHLNQLPLRGAMVLNLALSQIPPLPPVFRVADPDLLIRTARSDPAAIPDLLRPHSIAQEATRDWPDLLARALRRDPALSLCRWAGAHGLAAETVSRGFRRAYGTTAARYRAEARARAGWRRLIAGEEPVSDIAVAVGFADQAHFARAIVALTGRPPGAWRRVNSVQDRAASSA